MSQNEKPKAAFAISLIAGILILINGLLLGAAGAFIGGINLTGSADVAGLISLCPFVSDAAAAGATEAELLALCPFISEPPIANITLADVQIGLTVISTMLYAGMVLGVAFGVIILLGAFMAYRNPANKKVWGVIIILLSMISIITGGGFLIGFILGIIGGALIFQWKPKTPTTEAVS